MSWIRSWWQRRQRRLDVKILWPEILEAAPNRAIAELAFRKHMDLDPAYRDMDVPERECFLGELP